MNIESSINFFKLLATKELTRKIFHINSDTKSELQLMEDIDNAKKEWLAASKNFEFAEDLDTIDYYSYKIKACQIKYNYLIKKAKQHGVEI